MFHESGIKKERDGAEGGRGTKQPLKSSGGQRKSPEQMWPSWLRGIPYSTASFKSASRSGRRCRSAEASLQRGERFTRLTVGAMMQSFSSREVWGISAGGRRNSYTIKRVLMKESGTQASRPYLKTNILAECAAP